MTNKNNLKKAIDDFYKKNELYDLYKEYLYKWIALGYIGKDLIAFDIDSINESTKKEVFVSLLAETYQPEIFSQLFESLDADVKKMFLDLIFENNSVLHYSKISDYVTGYGADDRMLAKYGFFKLKKIIRLYNQLYIELDHNIKINLRIALKNYTDAFELHHVENFKTQFSSNDEKDFWTNFSKYYEFYKSGKIKLTDSWKVLKETKKNLHKYCEIKEFYPNIKNLEFLKAESISLFFTIMDDAKTRNENYFQTANAKNIVLDFMKGNYIFKNNANVGIRSNFAYLPYIINYLKGFSKYEKISERANIVFPNINSVLAEINISETIAVKNIINTLMCRNIDLEILDYDYIRENTYINESNYERTKINTYDKFVDYLIEPMIKSYIFFLGLLGVFEIYYDLPSECKTLYLKNDFLSSYDGIKYIKFTDFGAYVFDKISSYNFDIESAESGVSLHDNLLIATVFGDAPLERMFFENHAKKIGQNTYRMNDEIIMKKIKSINDFKKIQKDFLAIVPKEDIKKHWKEFFDNIETKINSISPVNNFKILKINPENKNILNIVTKDQRIKKIAFKAENYHLLVEEVNLDKLIEIFNEYGYTVFTDNDFNVKG